MMRMVSAQVAAMAALAVVAGYNGHLVAGAVAAVGACLLSAVIEAVKVLRKPPLVINHTVGEVRR